MIEQEQREFEPTPERAAADFEGYRRVVDTLSPAFRKVGIVDEAGYDRAIRDPRTMKLAIGRVELPFLTPVAYVSGYDAERSGRLTGQGENVYVMSVPLGVLTGPDVRILPEESEFSAEDSAIIIETDTEETEETQQILPAVLSDIGGFEVAEFHDERIKNPNQQSAMMAMYDAHFVAVDEQGERIPSTGKGFYEAYDELAVADHPLTQRTKLLRLEELREDEAIIEALWDLCSDRFEWLGKAHPVSMEDTREFFEQMVLSNNTHTIVRNNDEGIPRCLGFFMASLKECTWMKPEVIEQLENEARAKGQQILYFFGIAGQADGGDMHYGQDVMQLVAHIVQGMGGQHRLLFESTNMSSRYIPRMVGQYIGQGEGVEMSEPVKKIAQIDYWYMAPTSSD